ncbi:MAG TPA: MATE family efflux transporter [Anaeromyxobacter sp.]|nr:MATE family efflux transporter [Anaeromyxobacter sp.]
MPAHPDRLRGELGALVRLALPLAAAQGGQSLMGVVDTAVVGRAGALPLAGVGLGNVLFMALSVIGMGVMHGLDPLVSQALGAGDAARARRLLWQGVWLAAGLSAVLAAPFLLAPPLLTPLGIEPAVAREAGRYLLWRLPGLPFFLAFLAGRAYLQGLGSARPMVIATAVANVANVPLDVLLVLGGASLPAWTGPLRAVPALGAAGAAIATSLVSALQLAIVARAAAAVPPPGGRPPPRRPDRGELAAAVRVGVPIGLHMGAEVGIFALVGFLAARLGAHPLAAHQVAISVASLTFTVAVGFGNAGSVRVGWAVGARDREGARRAGLTAFGAGAAFMAAAALGLLAFPGAVARLMTGDPAVIAAAVPLLRVAAVFQISDGIQAVGAGVLRGAGETRFTFVANLLGHWALGFPAAVLLAFPAGGGVTGLWWGFVIGLSAVGAALLGRFLRISAREIAPLVERA